MQTFTGPPARRENERVLVQDKTSRPQVGSRDATSAEPILSPDEALPLLTSTLWEKEVLGCNVSETEQYQEGKNE